ALRKQGKHNQARYDKGAVADAPDFGNAVANGGAKNNEVQRSGYDGRNDALHQRAPGSGHFKAVNGAHCGQIHGALRTSFTKISSSELCLVCRSLKAMPASARSLNRPAMSFCSCCVS